MAVTGESRLFEVMQTLNELELKVEALFAQKDDDKKAPNEERIRSIVEETQVTIIENYNESNEIPNNDSVVDLIGEQVSDQVSSALEDYDPSDAIQSHLEYEDYCTSDVVRDMINEYAPDHNDEFLEEAESFFRQIISGLPSCWIQAIARILDIVNNDSEGKSRSRSNNQRNLTLKNKTIKILEDEHDFNYQEVLNKVTNDHDEGIKKEALEKDQKSRVSDLRNAKLKVESLEDAIKKEMIEEQEGK